MDATHNSPGSAPSTIADEDQTLGGEATVPRVAPDEQDEPTQYAASQQEPAVQPMQLRLSYLNWSEVFVLQPGDNVIGRPSGAGRDQAPDIPLYDSKRYISRRHAVIRVVGTECSILDERSVNGAYLNGQLLQRQRPYPLHDGDVVTIEGRQLTLMIT